MNIQDILKKLENHEEHNHNPIDVHLDNPHFVCNVRTASLLLSTTPEKFIYAATTIVAQKMLDMEKDFNTSIVFGALMLSELRAIDIIDKSRNAHNN